MVWNADPPPSPPYPVNSSEPKILLKSGKLLKIKDMFTAPKNGIKTKLPDLDENDRIWVCGSVYYQ